MTETKGIQTFDDNKKPVKTKQEEIREGIAKRKLEIVTRCESRLIKSLPVKTQKKIDYTPFTWDTIDDGLKEFWLREADMEMREMDAQGVGIKAERELPEDKDNTKTRLIYNGVLQRQTDFDTGYFTAKQDMLKAGYVAVEPLIEG